VLTLLGARTDAAVVFRFATDRTSYQVVPGGRVAVHVLLEEQIGPTDVSVLATEGGLFSAGLKLAPVPPLPTYPAAVAGLSDIVGDPGFTGGSLKNLSPLTLILNDGLFDEPGPIGDPAGNGIRQVHLASFTFTASTIPGQVTTIKVTDYDDFGKSSDTLTWPGTELDNAITPGQFTITTVVPEPGTGFTLLAVGLLASLGARRPCWRRTQGCGNSQPNAPALPSVRL
jgi:hypothetical protein